MLTISHSARKVSRYLGFTMVELMVTMAVMAVLAAIALPSFQIFMAENRASSKTMELVAAIKTAQSEALRRSRQVLFTFTDSSMPSTALVGAINGKSWATVVLPLADAPSSVTPEVVNVGGYSEGTADVVVDASTTAMCFMPDGSIKANTATGVSGANCSVNASSGAQFLIQPSRGTKRWQISVSPTGKVTSCLGAVGGGVFTCS
ncbi:GspH/FimT family pseudopilin [Comamonas testosteroni]